MQKPLTTFVVRQYLVRVETVKAQREKYYKRGERLPKTYTKERGYTFSKEGYLIGPDGYRVMSNPHSAGEPKYEKLAGNKFSYAGWNPHLRARLVEALKDHYTQTIIENVSFPTLKRMDEALLQRIEKILAGKGKKGEGTGDLEKRRRLLRDAAIKRKGEGRTGGGDLHFEARDFPLKVEWDLYTTVEKPNFDLSNLWFYYKYFEDTLVDLGVLQDDCILYVTHPPSPRLIPVKDWEDRAFVFRFYHDNREELQQHPLWSPPSSVTAPSL